MPAPVLDPSTCDGEGAQGIDVVRIGSVRCIIIPIDGDCALGFRCIEFTSCSMADEQFASLICSQLKIGLAHRGAKTSGRKCDLLQILYDD